jgi:UDP:flavonoid glycosyltransferase YjiC (YdhE family)
VSTIVFVEMPAFGHVNPSLPLARELGRRGERVIYFNDAEFSQAVSEGSSVDFRPYPPAVVTSAMIARATQTGDLIRVPRVILRATETLVPFLLERMRADSPDAVVLDSNAFGPHRGSVAAPAVCVTHDHNLDRLGGFPAVAHPRVAAHAAADAAEPGANRGGGYSIAARV